MAAIKPQKNWDRRIEDLTALCQFEGLFEHTIFYDALNAMMDLAIEGNDKDGMLKVLKAAEIPLDNIDLGKTDRKEVEETCQAFIQQRSVEVANKTAPNTPDVSDDEAENKTDDFRKKLNQGRDEGPDSDNQYTPS